MSACSKVSDVCDTKKERERACWGQAVLIKVPVIEGVRGLGDMNKLMVPCRGKTKNTMLRSGGRPVVEW